VHESIPQIKPLHADGFDLRLGSCLVRFRGELIALAISIPDDHEHSKFLNLCKQLAVTRFVDWPVPVIAQAIGIAALTGTAVDRRLIV